MDDEPKFVDAERLAYMERAWRDDFDVVKRDERALIAALVRDLPTWWPGDMAPVDLSDTPSDRWEVVSRAAVLAIVEGEA